MSREHGPGAQAVPTAIVVDLDGTLLHSDGTASERSLDVLDEVRDRGVFVLIATGRTPRAVRSISGFQRFGTMVCANGAVIWDAASDRLNDLTEFDADGLSQALAQLSSGGRELGIAVLSCDRMFANRRYRGSRALGAGLFAWESDQELPAGERIVSVRVIDRSEPTSDLETAISAAFRGVGTCVNATSHADVMPDDVTKATAVERLLAELGCSLSSAACFGDADNDLPLIELAGWTYAVANATPQVLMAAQQTIASNDEDGVAAALTRLFELSR